MYHLLIGHAPGKPASPVIILLVRSCGSKRSAWFPHLRLPPHRVALFVSLIHIALHVPEHDAQFFCEVQCGQLCCSVQGLAQVLHRRNRQSSGRNYHKRDNTLETQMCILFSYAKKVINLTGKTLKRMINRRIFQKKKTRTSL